MGKDGLTGSPFDKAACPTPGASGGTTVAMPGGEGLTDMPPETANMSELGRLPARAAVKDGPGTWSHVDVEPGVASPTVAVTNMDKK